MESTSTPLEAQSFPILSARTRHFSLGMPRTFTLAPDGERVYFLRSDGPFDPVLSLWCLDLGGEGAGSGTERRIVDPVKLLGSGDEEVPEIERQRRERLREVGGGITAYSVDAGVTRAAFALSGQLFVVELVAPGVPRRVGGLEGVIDPRLDPTGSKVALVADGALQVVDVLTGEARIVDRAGPEGSVGLADFVAAEEFDRARGHWWSPDGTGLLFETVDESPVGEMWIFDPADPATAPTSRRYPKAGGANPVVGLKVSDLAHDPVKVIWDTGTFPYVVTAGWTGTEDARPLVTLANRHQNHQIVVTVDATTGVTTTEWEDRDEAFLEWIPGLPAVTPDGRLLVGRPDRELDTYAVAEVRDSRAHLVTPVGLQVTQVAEVTAGALVVTAQNTPTTQMVVEFASDGTPVRQSPPDRFVRLLAASAGGPWVVATSETDRAQTTVSVQRLTRPEIPVASHALAPLQAVPPVEPRPTFLEVGEHALSVAVLLPRRELGLTGPFPVLMAPYGGPHHQRVVASRLAYADDQYLADQGFCVVVADGRGTGGRGPAWDRWMHRDLGEVAVEDQVAALAGVVEHLGTDVVDPGRVGVVGWSFGGYLAARCVLARPDVFHAAVAGAPVTDWAWYDTGYTERYLGLPEDDAARWERQSLLPLAAGLERPLLLIHGYLDDNVFFAHTQLLSDALTAAGRPHRVLGLSGITHMAADPVVAENLLRLQVGFFQEALG